MKRHADWALSITTESVDLQIKMEQERGFDKFGGYNSMHEAKAVIEEELDEFWDSVKGNDPDPKELLQICATARRALLELCQLGRVEIDRGWKSVRAGKADDPKVTGV